MELLKRQIWLKHRAARERFKRGIVGTRLMRSHWLAPRDDGEDQIAVRT
jgi:hypothetical protein